MALALCAIGAAAEAAGAPRVTVTTFPSPPRSGWVELTFTVETAGRPWHGVLTAGDRDAVTGVALALSANAHRVVTLPFRAARAEPIDVTVDGALAARLDVEPADGAVRTVIVAERGGPAMGVPLAELPGTWRALESVSLVMLPPGGQARLRPGQEAALETWVRRGGAVATPGAGAEVRALGQGVALAAENRREVERAHAEWRRRTPVDPGAGVERAWNAAMRDLRVPAIAAAGVDFRLVVGVYLVTAAAGSALVATVAAMRPFAVPITALVIVAGSLATWSTARASSAAPTMREVAVVRADPEGGRTDVRAVVDVVAGQRVTARFASRLASAAVHEVRATTTRLDRVVRLDGRAGGPPAWERAWAARERVRLMVVGDGADPGVRARAVATGAVRTSGAAAWELASAGGHALRSVVVRFADGATASVPDVAPGRTVTIPGPAARAASSPDLSFWRPVLPEPGSNARPIVLATLDPPIASLELLGNGAATVERTSHVVLSLPMAAAGGGR